jgi:hypothetical protein
LPGEVADATGASQFSDTSVWFVDEPPLFGGGSLIGPAGSWIWDLSSPSLMERCDACVIK